MKCGICEDNIPDGISVWTVEFNFSNPDVKPQEKIMCCNLCKLEICEYIRRFSNIKMAEIEK